MIARIATAAAAAVGFALVLTTAAGAASTVRLRASDIDFFAGPLAIVAHGDVSVDATSVGHGSADAAFVDLRKNRLVLAGHAVLGAQTADALAVDLEHGRVDALRVEDGATAGISTFPTPIRAAIFIRARRATIVPHANVRFTPATFPTSAGAPPVPSYLYTFASNSGFAAQSLPGASFDQPYGIVGSPSSLLAGHLRYVQGTGLDLAVDKHLVDGNRSFLVTSIDAPETLDPAARIQRIPQNRRALYRRDRRRRERADVLLPHRANGRVRSGRRATRHERLLRRRRRAPISRLRGPDRPLFLGLTYRVQGDLGDAVPARRRARAAAGCRPLPRAVAPRPRSLRRDAAGARTAAHHDERDVRRRRNVVRVSAFARDVFGNRDDDAPLRPADRDGDLRTGRRPPVLRRAARAVLSAAEHRSTSRRTGRRGPTSRPSRARRRRGSTNSACSSSRHRRRPTA